MQMRGLHPCIRNLALPGKSKVIPASLFPPDAVGGDGKNPVLKASGDHCFLCPRKHKVGRMSNDLCTFSGQGTAGFRENPVETDHDPSSHHPR